jgi:hypothetical protein
MMHPTDIDRLAVYFWIGIGFLPFLIAASVILQTNLHWAIWMLYMIFVIAETCGHLP